MTSPAVTVCFELKSQVLYRCRLDAIQMVNCFRLGCKPGWKETWSEIFMLLA